VLNGVGGELAVDHLFKGEKKKEQIRKVVEKIKNKK
jgi:hypothetical protein